MLEHGNFVEGLGLYSPNEWQYAEQCDRELAVHRGLLLSIVWFQA